MKLKDRFVSEPIVEPISARETVVGASFYLTIYF